MLMNQKQITASCQKHIFGNLNFNNTKDMKVWVFHHRDADGYCSGFLARKWFESTGLEIKSYSCDYNTNFKQFPINANDIVCFVDLSFTHKTKDILLSLDVITKNIIWIDHHQSSIDMIREDKYLAGRISEWALCVLGDSNNLYSAALLTYYALFNRSLNEELIYVPEFVYLVSDWDTWRHEDSNSIYFNQAINAGKIHLVDSEGNYDTENDWEKLLDEAIDNEFHSPHLTDMISRGRLVVENKRALDERYLKSNGFEFNLLGYKILACNQRSNSLLFGDRIDDYDMVCPFVMHERNGKFIYTYSLFSSDNNISCKDIAEYFGGGGHKGAAGFSLPFNIFTTKFLKLKVFLHKLKNKKRTK